MIYWEGRQILEHNILQVTDHHQQDFQ
eukprot:SAG22_NODE_13563_length_402_cov_0.854785_1_plen_26_part_10